MPIAGRIIAINGESLEGKLDAFNFAVHKIKTAGRPLNVTFETMLSGAEAQAVLRAAIRRTPAVVDKRVRPVGAPSLPITDDAPPVEEAQYSWGLGRMLQRLADAARQRPSADARDDLGGAPASEVADADADFKEALFRGTKLGIDLLAGPSIGHLPVLGAALEAEDPGFSLK